MAIEEHSLPECNLEEIETYAGWMANRVSSLDNLRPGPRLEKITMLDNMHATMVRRANIFFQTTRSWPEDPVKRRAVQTAKDRLRVIQSELTHIQTRTILDLAERNISGF